MKPMLAATADPQKLDELHYPLLASPKLDGVRALIVNGVVMSRSMKPIPNRHVQFLFGDDRFNGLDGELIVGSPTSKTVFRDTMSGVMSEAGKPSVTFCVFDDASNMTMPFDMRCIRILKRLNRLGLSWLQHVTVRSAEELQQFEADMLSFGYEGVMLRDPQGPYKQGRSTVREGYLLKLKRFADSEAEILGFTELMHNANEERTATGRRSTKKTGMEGLNTLGALKVRDIHSGVEFEVGSGFTEEERALIWATKDGCKGTIIKYQFFDNGSKDKPRFPTFLGFRNKIDL